MGVYSNNIRTVAIPSETRQCVVLPAPIRGELNRIVIYQVSGADEGFNAELYDRKGACENENDLNTLSGDVSSVVNNGSTFCRITVSAAHNLSVGDTIELKNNTISGYNVTHTVTAVISSTVVDTDVAYSADGANGLWQKTPELAAFATLSPSSHKIYNTISLGASAGGESLNAFLSQEYSNRDNQNVNSRRQTSAIYLDLKPLGTGDKVFDVGYTIVPALID